MPGTCHRDVWQLQIMTRQATINNVADLSGVSKRTVSRVINQSPNVTKDTRQKVLAVIQQLGYSPDPRARGLANRRSYLIGLIYDNPNALYISDIQAGILRACRGTGYELIMHPVDIASQHLQNEAKHFIERTRLDGVILLSPISQLEGLASYLVSANCHYVRISPKKVDKTENIVISNDRKGAFLMTEHLIELGHRDIGFILGPPTNLSSMEKFDGFREAMDKHKVPVQKALVMEGANTFESGVAAGRRALQRTLLPSVIFASNDEMALGVLKTAQMLGISVPESLSIAGYDDSAYASKVWPDLTTVNQPLEDMGILAAQKLMAQFSTGEKDVNFADVSFEPKLVVRHSTAAPRKYAVT